jgi:hypothetical protein
LAALMPPPPLPPPPIAAAVAVANTRSSASRKGSSEVSSPTMKLDTLNDIDKLANDPQPRAADQTEKGGAGGS